LLPEALLAAVFLRFASCLGTNKVYRERVVFRARGETLSIGSSSNTESI
jgi:hypothetical protein